MINDHFVPRHYLWQFTFRGSELIQVKQRYKVGRTDVDSFEAMMMPENTTKAVREILDEEIARKLV